jgi:hypothetical protein
LLRSLVKILSKLSNQVDAITKDEGPSTGAKNTEPIRCARIEALLPREVTEHYRAEQKDRPSETKRKRWTFRLEIAGVAVAAALAGFTLSTLREIQKQTPAITKASRAAQDQIAAMQKQTELAERPWVKIVSITPKSQLAFGTDTVSLSFSITMKNVGKSVALNVSPVGKLFPATFDEPLTNAESMKWKNALCGQPKPVPNPNPNPHPLVSSLYLFPGDQTSAKDGDSGTPTDYAFSSSIPQDEITNTILPRFPGQIKRYLSLVLVGCVEYQFSFQGELHHTHFNYTVIRFPPPLPLQEGFEIGRNVPANQIKLVPSFRGGNTVD